MRWLAVLVAVLAGCDWSLHRMQEPVGCRTHGATTLLADGSCDLQPPDGVVSTEPVIAPPPVTRALLERGRDRFERICAPCHGVAADGDSYIARAMTLRRPPSLVDDAAAHLADDRVLTVIATGYGLMPSYASLVAPPDRYAILHFLRAMQARDVPLDALSPAQQQEARTWLH